MSLERSHAAHRHVSAVVHDSASASHGARLWPLNCTGTCSHGTARPPERLGQPGRVSGKSSFSGGYVRFSLIYWLFSYV